MQYTLQSLGKYCGLLSENLIITSCQLAINKVNGEDGRKLQDLGGSQTDKWVGKWGIRMYYKVRNLQNFVLCSQATWEKKQQEWE